MDTLKSTGAVFAGMLTIVVLSTATDAVLEKLGIFPPLEKGLFIPWMLALALVYRSVYAIAGGFITAMLAPKRPMQHAIILGGIGVVISIIGVFVAWDMSPHWYPIALVLTALPCTWLGGRTKTQ